METNGLKLRDGLCIQASVIVLSVKSFTDWNRILDSSCIVLARRDARTAACNSNLGMLSCFNGATRDFAAINLTWYLHRLFSGGCRHKLQRHLETRLRIRTALAVRLYSHSTNFLERLFC